MFHLWLPAGAVTDAEGSVTYTNVRSSDEAYLRTLPPRGHSTVRVPNHCEGFMAIWLRAREEFMDNRFQLLFILRTSSRMSFDGSAFPIMGVTAVCSVQVTAVCIVQVTAVC